MKNKKCPILFIINNKYFHGPSLHTYFKSPNISGPNLLLSEFVMVRVCYGPSCPVTHFSIVATRPFSLPCSENDRVVTTDPFAPPGCVNSKQTHKPGQV